MPTQRVRAAEHLQTSMRWDRKFALLAADRVIEAGKYDIGRERHGYDSMQWLKSMTDDELYGRVPAPAWFPDVPLSRLREMADALAAARKGEITMGAALAIVQG